MTDMKDNLEDLKRVKYGKSGNYQKKKIFGITRFNFLHFFTRKTTYLEGKISDDTLHFK